ncbi:MAG: class IV adenylate cyclase [Methanoregula sp.]|nr:class IV adenylate cyclase [Methanoregula sp.]
MLEVELKVKVPSLESVRKLLHENGAENLGRIHEHDIYYNAPHRDFGITDEAVRVRYTNEHAVVTYKGAKIKKFGLKAREELNTAVESGEVFEAMLDRLGFTKTTEVDKWRENFRFSGAAICLDEVNELGTYVEIEIMTSDENSHAEEEIKKIAHEIGVTGEPILASYLELLLAERVRANH